MSKIKVLMVLGSTNMGGAQMFILNFLRNLNLKDYQIDFAVNFKEKGGGIGDEIGKMGCRVYYLPYFKVYNYLGYVKAWKNSVQVAYSVAAVIYRKNCSFSLHWFWNAGTVRDKLGLI